MMEDLKFKWDASFEADAKQNEAGSLVIAGELVNGDVCANNFALDVDELPKLAAQVKDATLRIDHGQSVRDVIGGFRVGTYDKDKKRVMFEAEVDDPVIQRSIIKGRLKYISIGASADAFCSGCGKSTKPFRACKCNGSHEVIKNIKLKEGSIVLAPAYGSSSFQPQGFIASITSALAEDIVMPKSSNEDEARPILPNKNIGEEKNMSENKEVQATIAKPAGPDAVVLLAEKLEALTAKMEERFKKEDDEAKKKVKEEEWKKNEAVMIKFEEIATKLDEALKIKKDTSPGIPKDVDKSKFEEKKEAKKEPPAEEEEEEEEEDKTKKTKKEAKGAKVEDASGNTVVTADAVPEWFKEIIAYAKKNNILDY